MYGFIWLAVVAMLSFLAGLYLAEVQFPRERLAGIRQARESARRRVALRRLRRLSRDEKAEAELDEIFKRIGV